MPDGSAFGFGSAPSPEELAGYDLNDFGNAMRLIRLVGGSIDGLGVVCTDSCRLLWQLGQGWVGFNGRFWDREFGEQEAVKRAHEVGQKIRGLYPELLKKGLSPKDAMKFIDGVGQRGAVSAMLSSAASYLTVKIDAFDRNPMTVNCKSGTLHLSRDAGGLRIDLRPHDPADRITRFLDVDYDPKAEAPEFIATLKDSLPEPDVRGFFQRAHGYSFTGHVYEQAMFICQGLGRDGKSTLLDVIRETQGSYGAVGKVETFLDVGQRGGGDAAPDIVELAGDVRMAVLSEPPRGAKLNEGLLKAWTSGSPISARQLREKPFTFRPIPKLWMECNAFPVARGDDDGVWRRIFPVLFERQVDPLKVDKMLKDRILARERAGVLNWLLAGVGDWLERGLDPPERVKKALDDYRKQSSPFGDWLNERCVWGQAVQPGTRTLTRDLYGDYKDWAEGQGIEKPMSQRAFGDALHQRQVLLAGKDSNGLKYRGPIRLKTALEREEDLAAAEARAAAARPPARPRSDEPEPGAGGPESGGFDPDDRPNW